MATEDLDGDLVDFQDIRESEPVVPLGPEHLASPADSRERFEMVRVGVLERGLLGPRIVVRRVRVRPVALGPDRFVEVVEIRTPNPLELLDGFVSPHLPGVVDPSLRLLV
ncbi:hypothetical protein BRD06_12010 [Halobacteriales archaeon QS_9_67_15]|nr:MAG: hypothetical protein BRD06_12010 [Halobacteriales archaeon QS_9_67_15]